MARPALGALVREGTRSGVVVGHPGRGSMVDVKFRDVTFVERRDAGNLKVEEYDFAEEQKRAVVEGVYESLVTKHLGVKAFKDARGQRADVKALAVGTLTRDDVNALLGRAYAIATAQGRKQGDVSRDGAKATATGRALAALRYGADPRLVERQLRAEGVSADRIARVQRLAASKDRAKLDENREDYEVTLSLRRKKGGHRYTVERLAGEVVYVVQPGGKVYKTEAGAKRAVEKLDTPPTRRNSAISAAAAAAREAAALAPAAAAFASRYGKAAWTAAKGLLATPEGKRLATQVTTTATTLLGAEAVRKGKLSEKDAALVRRAVERQTGEKMDPIVVEAVIAAHGKAR